ncbi:hypothetical protein BC831DRAFT_462463 [Entophlyctis helioformis]|nr:hypothetical protein BC831DRAFT_462463 [Entophlyctis helioformis]
MLPPLCLDQMRPRRHSHTPAPPPSMLSPGLLSPVPQPLQSYQPLQQPHQPLQPHQSHQPLQPLLKPADHRPDAHALLPRPQTNGSRSSSLLMPHLPWAACSLLPPHSKTLAAIPSILSPSPSVSPLLPAAKGRRPSPPRQPDSSVDALASSASALPLHAESAPLARTDADVGNALLLMSLRDARQQ